MVFVWSQLTKGDPAYTLAQVGVNDAIMVVAFAPIVALLLGVTGISVPWETLLLSVVLYVVIPLIAGILARRMLLRRGGAGLSMPSLHGFKTGFGDRPSWQRLFCFLASRPGVILARPLVIALIAVPILIQSYGIFAAAYAAVFAWKVPHRVAAPLRADRHLELLRARGCRRDQPVRPRVGRRACHGGRSPRRSAGDALARRFANRTRANFEVFEKEPA